MARSSSTRLPDGENFNIDKILIYSIIFISWASTYLYVPTLATYAASRQYSSIMIGLIIGGFGFMQAVLRAPFGILSDFLKKRKIIVCFGMFTAFIGPLGMALFSSEYGLLIFRTLSGITAATWPVTTILVASYFSKEEAPNAVAKSNLINGLGNVFGMLLGGFVVAKFSQQAAFLVSSLLGLVAFFISVFLKDNPPNDFFPITLQSVFIVLKNRYLLIASFLAFTFQLIITGTSTSFTPIYAQSIGAKPSQLGILAMLSMLGIVVGAGLRKWIVHIFRGTRLSVAAAFFIFSLSTMAIVLTKNLNQLFLFQFIQGFSGYLILVVLMGECITPFSQEIRGAAMGVFHSLFGLGMFFGPLMSGFLYSEFSLNFVFGSLSVLALLTGFVALFTFYSG